MITLNVNRIVQMWSRESNSKTDWESLKQYLINILNRVYKYHKAFKYNLYKFEKAGQLTASKAGYISMDRLYSTIGVNGFNEAAMFLGMKVSDNEDYKKFCNLITSTISEQNKLNSTPKYKFNQEFVPAESLGSKNFNWDRNDGFWVPEDGRVLYNSYFYDAHDETSPLEKLRMHGRDYTKNLDGRKAAC